MKVQVPAAGAFAAIPAALAATVALLGYVVPAAAVPSFADQTGQPCQACHVGGFGPQLTPFGRLFKLHGYTMRAKSFNVPLSAMAVASYTSTRRDQAAPPADGFSTNDNLAFDQGSIFLAGGIGSHFGGFVQTTYDGVAKAWTWDNVDLRAVGTGQLGGKEIVYGLSFNNSPTTQDVWNTLPAWGYPYTGSALAPSPATSPLIAGGLAQNVVGLNAYAWIDSRFYIEAGGYSTPSRGTLRWLGADPFDPGDIHGLAPYGRIAFQHDLAGGTAELGAFALRAALWPGRDRSSGYTDHYTDLGLDASWIKTFGANDTITINARYTHETRRLRATCALGIADGSIDPMPLDSCANGTLSEVRADASYYWHNKIGATIGAFDLTGSGNQALYSDNRTMRPDSSGLMLQLDGTPFGSGHSPFGPRFNLRLGVQYTKYFRFDGARRDYDGAGTNAADNDTVRIFTWVAF